MRDLDLVQEGLRRFDFCARNQLRAGDVDDFDASALEECSKLLAYFSQGIRRLIVRSNEDNRGLSIMDKPTSLKSDLPTHGASILPSVTIDSYNIEVRDEDGFIGDKASKGAFCDS
jgi:hypothetical protein